MLTIVQLASESDLSAVARLQVQAFAGKFARLFPSAGAAECLIEAEMRAELDRTIYPLVAKRGPGIVGMLVLRIAGGRPKEATAELRRLFSEQVPWWQAPRVLLGQVVLEHHPGQGEAYVETLAVEEKARGQGIGTLLLGEAETWACDHDMEMLSLQVSVHNRRARALYERQGFAVRVCEYSLLSGLLLGHWGFHHMSKILRCGP